MIALLLLAAAAPQTAVEAEHAFAADAQRIGQWSAFRKWSAPDAVIFVPEPANAQEYLKPLRDPAKSVEWWPTSSFVSCDGKMAVNVGGAHWPDGHASAFTTIWSRAGGQWRWTFDNGDNVATLPPRPSAPAVRRAACGSKPADPITVQFRTPPVAQANGASPDGTLTYHWHIRNHGEGASLRVWLWNGNDWSQVLPAGASPVPAP